MKKRKKRDAGVITRGEARAHLAKDRRIARIRIKAGTISPVEAAERIAGIFNRRPSIKNRQYLPTLSDLIDRLTIVLQKEVFIPGHREEYRREQEAIMHDIDIILSERPPILAQQIRAICILQLANRYVWERETKIRDDSSDESAEVQLSHLRATHSVNGVRNTAKNAISAFDGGRLDYKVDALAANLSPEHGNWRVFEK